MPKNENPRAGASNPTSVSITVTMTNQTRSMLNPLNGISNKGTTIRMIDVVSRIVPRKTKSRKHHNGHESHVEALQTFAKQGRQLRYAQQSAVLGYCSWKTVGGGNSLDDIPALAHNTTSTG